MRTRSRFWRSVRQATQVRAGNRRVCAAAVAAAMTPPRRLGAAASAATCAATWRRWAAAAGCGLACGLPLATAWPWPPAWPWRLALAAATWPWRPACGSTGFAAVAALRRLRRLAPPSGALRLGRASGSASARRCLGRGRSAAGAAAAAASAPGERGGDRVPRSVIPPPTGVSVSGHRLPAGLGARPGARPAVPRAAAPVAADVDAPAGQLRRQARVLALAADGQREHPLGHGDAGDAGILVDVHLDHLGRAGARWPRRRPGPRSTG